MFSFCQTGRSPRTTPAIFVSNRIPPSYPPTGPPSCTPVRDDGDMPDEWVRYRRLADAPLEAMHARFDRHVYHRHSHETYSFGVTESGAQAFTCRGGAHTSTAGTVLAFNPDD